MIYIVDIDDTICVSPINEDGKKDYNKAVPILDKINKVNKLYDEGHTIHYWTARGSITGIDWFELTVRQLNDWGCKYHSVKTGKPAYDFWIDDKAINIKDF